MSTLITVDDYEKKALSNLNRMTADYYKSGANEEVTLRENREAFKNYKIRPRFLTQNLSERNMSTTFLKTRVQYPIGVSPTAMQRMAHPEGELATARACQESGIVMILSTISTSSIEEVASAAPNAIKWFQLYIYKDREVTKSLVRRAENAGFKALVLTVDTPFFGTRWADSRNKFCLPPHLTLANLKTEKVKAMTAPKEGASSGLNEYATSLFDASLTWADVKWLKTITSLPILVKGILTAEDALMAVDNKVDGIIVSNHGARQLDHVPATIEALPEVARAIRSSNVELYVDGGFRTGTDVLKALALGARGVFLGRPVLWGLSVNGQQGVTDVLNIVKKELDIALALSGCSKLSDVQQRQLVVRKEFYSNL